MNAVIYCRVSSRDQVEGTSLESQETACREYAARHNLRVARVFIEEGESAKFADRTQLLELLSYCKDKEHGVEILLVWKVDRFARNVEDHYAVKGALRKVGVKIVSVTEPIESDPNGKLLETILAGFAQFDNDVRAVRTIQGMSQRLKEGIWPWRPPLGYLPPKQGKKTEPDRPDPGRFEPIRKAWELFATGAYRKAAILRLLEEWGVSGFQGGSIGPQRLDHMFSNPYYAGILRDPWTGAEHVGRHLPMVTPADFCRVQQIVATRANSQSHHRVQKEFELRGLVRCPSCQALMTGSFSKGRCRRYPYYRCFRGQCPTRTKSYSAGRVHEEFQQFLTTSSIAGNMTPLIVNALLSVAASQREEAKKDDVRRRDQKAALERQLSELILMRTSRLLSDEDFVKQRDNLKQRILTAEGRDEQQRRPLTEADARIVANSLADVKALWLTTPPEVRRGFEEVLLPSGFVLGKIRTAQKGLLFCTLEASGGAESALAALVRANANALMSQIHRLLAIIRGANEARQKAA